MNLSKTIILLFISFISLTAAAQTIPSKSKALSDFNLKKESVESQMKFLGIESGLKNVKIEQTEGPYRRYSIGSRTYYYDHVSEQDAAYFIFKLTTPVYDNGDQFVLRVEMDYDSYTYKSTGYRKSLGKYALRSAKVSVESYIGKDLSNAQLFEKLNDHSIKEGKSFEVDNNYHFTEIESVEFVKINQQNFQGTTLYNYEIIIKGVGADFRSNGSDYVEYEIVKKADLEAHYKAQVGLSKGQWKFVDYSLKPNREKTKLANIEKDPNVPAYESLRYKSLKEIMNGPIVADDISIYSYKYMNDLKSLVLYRLNSTVKDDFLQGDLLTNLFSTEQGKSALNQFYGLKKTMQDYYLDSVKCTFASNATLITKGGSCQFDLSYSVQRKPSKELSKKAKADGADKGQLAVIKYPAKGYYSLRMELSVVNGNIVVTDVSEPGRANRISYINGSDLRHPISTQD